MESGSIFATIPFLSGINLYLNILRLCLYKNTLFKVNWTENQEMCCSLGLLPFYIHEQRDMDCFQNYMDSKYQIKNISSSFTRLKKLLGRTTSIFGAQALKRKALLQNGATI